MRKLMQHIGALLVADATLLANVDSIGGSPAITQWRSFENPKEMEGRKPRVVWALDGSEDELGLSGAGINVVLETKVWGYGPAMLGSVLDICQRLDELILRRFEVTNGGGTLRWRAVPGWQRVDDADALAIHYTNRYITRYWSLGRITALTS